MGMNDAVDVSEKCVCVCVVWACVHVYVCAHVYVCMCVRACGTTSYLHRTFLLLDLMLGDCLLFCLRLAVSKTP